jgi:low temperature requirement protein LtrA
LSFANSVKKIYLAVHILVGILIIIVQILGILFNSVIEDYYLLFMCSYLCNNMGNSEIYEENFHDKIISSYPVAMYFSSFFVMTSIILIYTIKFCYRIYKLRTLLREYEEINN